MSRAIAQPVPIVLPKRPVTPWRWGLAAVGVACFGLAMVGAVVPGLPTTVFVLVGSYFLTRSCPWLEQRLLNVRLLRPYAEFVRSTAPMSSRARYGALAAMSVSVAVSLALLWIADGLTPVVGGLIGVLWLIGVVAILRFRRPRGSADGI